MGYDEHAACAHDFSEVTGACLNQNGFGVGYTAQVIHSCQNTKGHVSKASDVSGGVPSWVSARLVLKPDRLSNHASETLISPSPHPKPYSQSIALGSKSWGHLPP